MTLVFELPSKLGPAVQPIVIFGSIMLNHLNMLITNIFGALLVLNFDKILIFLKLCFEIAVAQQTRTRDQTFERVVEPTGTARGVGMILYMAGPKS